MHCGCDFLIKNFATHFKGKKRKHMPIFHRSVHISLRPTKAEVQVLHPGHSAESHPKENPVHRFNSRGHRTHGQGHNAYDICSDVFFQIRTREQESGIGTGFPPGTSVSPVSIFTSTLHTHLYLHVYLSEGQMGETWEHSDKANISGYQRKSGG